MARPSKREDYIVNRVADLFLYHDQLWSLPPDIRAKCSEWCRVWMKGQDDPYHVPHDRHISNAIGELLCDLKPKLRPYILGLIADALKGKQWKRPDDMAEILEADRRARARYLPAKIKASFKEVQQEYGERLDRRAAEAAGIKFRKSKKTRSPRRKKHRGDQLNRPQKSSHTGRRTNRSQHLIGPV